MRSSTNPPVSIWVLAASCLAFGFGCALIADIEDRTSRPGSGGAGSGSSSSGDATSTSSSSGGGMGTGGMAPVSCDAMFPITQGCTPDMCMSTTDAITGCHCGDCGIDCGNGMGGQCVDSNGGKICPPKVIMTAPTPLQVMAIAAFGGNVVHAVFDPGSGKSSIRRFGLDGTPITPNVLDNFVGEIKAMAVDCGRVYFRSVTSNAGGKPALWHAPLAPNSQAMEFPDFPMGPDKYGSQFESIVVDERNVYWTDELGVGVWAKPGGPGVPTPPQRVPGHDMTTKAIGLAVRGTDVYWSTVQTVGEMNGRLWTASLAGGLPNSAVNKAGFPDKFLQVGMDESHVYWVATSSANHRIMKLKRFDPTMMLKPEEIATFDENTQLLGPLAVDAISPYLYVIIKDKTTMKNSTCRVRKDGMQPASNCVRYTGTGTPFELDEAAFALGGPRLYLASPRMDAIGQTAIHWITVGKLAP